MTRFYAPDIKQTLTLPEGESGHCCRVLRLSEGDDVEAVDGKGTLHRCRIIDAHPRRTGIEIIESIVEPRHWNPRITLALAPTKNMDRMEWLVEKAVEIGVDRIVFLDCEHSERRVVKPERIERIMVSAMKQSLKSRMPELTGMMPFATMSRKRMADCGSWVTATGTFPAKNSTRNMTAYRMSRFLSVRREISLRQK